MGALPKTITPEVSRRVIKIQVLTLVWMAVEAGVSLGAAWTARSPALVGFGGDSTVELLSAAVVLRRSIVLSTKPTQRDWPPESRVVCCLFLRSLRRCLWASATLRLTAEAAKNL